MSIHKYSMQDRVTVSGVYCDVEFRHDPASREITLELDNLEPSDLSVTASGGELLIKGLTGQASAAAEVDGVTVKGHGSVVIAGSVAGGIRSAGSVFITGSVVGGDIITGPGGVVVTGSVGGKVVVNGKTVEPIPVKAAKLTVTMGACDLTIRDGGDVLGKIVGSLKLRLNSMATVILNLDGPADVKANGMSKILLSGPVKDLDVNVKGMSTVRVEECANLAIKASGMSKVTVKKMNGAFTQNHVSGMSTVKVG